MTVRCKRLRIVERIETAWRQINRQKGFKLNGPIVQLRCDLAHATSVAWAGTAGRTIKRRLNLLSATRLALRIGAGAGVRFDFLKGLRTVIASDAKQRTENHPQGDDRDEGETKHREEIFLEVG